MQSQLSKATPSPKIIEKMTRPLAIVTLDSPIFTNTPREYDICKAIGAINTLAFLNASVLHIETEFLPFIQTFSVKVFDANTDYMKSHPRKFGHSVQLEKPYELDKLKALEDLLIEMIADAKDKIMGAV